MDLDVVGADDTVRGEVLAFEVRVDRHVVLSTASTYGRDEVDRCDAALLLDVGRGIGRQKEFHAWRNPVALSRIPYFSPERVDLDPRAAPLLLLRWWEAAAVPRWSWSARPSWRLWQLAQQ